MLGHRFIARPFMMKHGESRCIWSGEPLPEKKALFHITDGKDKVILYGTNLKNKENALRFFNFLYKFRFIIKPAILLTLLWYLVSVIMYQSSNKLIYLSLDSLILIFKMIIAFTVVSVSILYRFGKYDDNVKSIFPVHNLSLLGIFWTLWIFRVVGAFWIAEGILNIIGKR
jgi:hypothetical protein